MMKSLKSLFSFLFSGFILVSILIIVSGCGQQTDNTDAEATIQALQTEVALVKAKATEAALVTPTPTPIPTPTPTPSPIPSPTPKSLEDVDISEMFLQASDLIFGGTFSEEEWISCQEDPWDIGYELAKSERKAYGWGWEDCDALVSPTLSNHPEKWVNIKQTIWIFPNERIAQRAHQSLYNDGIIVDSGITLDIDGLEVSFTISGGWTVIIVRLNNFLSMIEGIAYPSLAGQDYYELAEKAVQRIVDSLTE